MMQFPYLRLMLILPTIVIVYWFWIRPLLKATPSLKAFYDAEAGWWAAFSDKFSGIKQKFVGALITLACLVVELWDHIAPALGAVDTTPLTSEIPSWAWPLIAIAATALLNYFRDMADKRHAEEAAALAAVATKAD